MKRFGTISVFVDCKTGNLAEKQGKPSFWASGASGRPLGERAFFKGACRALVFALLAHSAATASVVGRNL